VAATIRTAWSGSWICEQGYVQPQVKLETTCLVRRRAYATVDRDVAHLDAPATTHYAVNTGEHGQQEVEQDVWVRVEPVFAVGAAQVKEESTPPTRS